MARHTLRLHFDNLTMITASLLTVGTGGGAASLIKEAIHLADEVCRDLDVIQSILPESLDGDGPQELSLDPSQGQSHSGESEPAAAPPA